VQDTPTLTPERPKFSTARCGNDTRRKAYTSKIHVGVTTSQL
jgi:hypothetical protein